MRLHEAHALLLSHATSDNAKHMKMLYADSKGGFTSDSLLSEYVDSICIDTDKWLLAFPESLKSLTAVSKPKTAFLKLLTIPAIMTHLGAQRCFDVADSVSDSYKKLAKDLSHGRLLAETLLPEKAVEQVENHGEPETRAMAAALDVLVATGTTMTNDPGVSVSEEELLLKMARVIRELSVILSELLGERLPK